MIRSDTCAMQRSLCVCLAACRYIDPVLILELDEEQAAGVKYSGAVLDSTCLSPAAAAAKRTITVDKEEGTTVGSLVFTVSGTNTATRVRASTAVAGAGATSGDTEPEEKEEEGRVYSHSYTLAAQNSQPEDGPVTGTMSTTITTSSSSGGGAGTGTGEGGAVRGGAVGAQVVDEQVWHYAVADDSSFDREGGTLHCTAHHHYCTLLDSIHYTTCSVLVRQNAMMMSFTF